MERADRVWRPLGELLLEKGLLTRDELELALAEQADDDRLLGEILVERGYVSGPALAVALAEQCGVELDRGRGFGTGLWAEIERRHRAGRDSADAAADNVFKLEPVPPRVEIVPDPEPGPVLELLESENRRLQDEIERLRGEFTKLKLVESTPPQPTASHLLFVPTPARYLLVEHEGAPPRPGEELEVTGSEGRFLVAKIGRSPFPGEPLPCAFLLPLD